jgi:Fe/S biogenesis protein NfuA
MATITETARKRILNIIEQQTNKVEGLRLTVKSLVPTPEYRLDFVEAGKEQPDDVIIEADGIKIFVEPHRAEFLKEIKIDFINSLEHSGFKIENPIVAAKMAPPADSTPNLDSPEAETIQRVLDTQINPAVASHGGHIGLVDVKDDIVYIRMSGGCQGCGMATATLKQGVVGAIKRAVPAIKEVLDVTDHAGGMNPYYSPGK